MKCERCGKEFDFSRGFHATDGKIYMMADGFRHVVNPKDNQSEKVGNKE